MFLKLNTKLGGHTSLLEKCVAIEGLAGLDYEVNLFMKMILKVNNVS